MSHTKTIGLILGPLIMGALLLIPPFPAFTPLSMTALALTALMACWWVSEAIPIAATSLLPALLAPLLGLLTLHEALDAYAHPVIYLLVGGALVARAVQNTQLHRYFALTLLAKSRPSLPHIVLMFMVMTALLSMVISNTAATALMLPIALYVIQRLQSNAHHQPFAKALILGLAYAASIGGTATLIGTPPNALTAAYLADHKGIDIGFAQWLVIGMPLATIMLPCAWVSLTRLTYPVPTASSDTSLQSLTRALTNERHTLGPFTKAQRSVFVVFLAMVVLWMIRPILNTYPALTHVSDAAIALLAALSLFVLSHIAHRHDTPPLTKEDIKQLPWDVLLLFGGGLCLAAVMAKSGLVTSLATSFEGLHMIPLIILVLAITLITLFLTELNSNTATIATFLPLLTALAAASQNDVLTLVLPATFAASCAFMLPVATPPNAVAYASNVINIEDMMRAGFILNIIAAIIITLLTTTIATSLKL
ncbi:MAG: DASS family sodium-coupled anion symporter [Alphaproteobacteria bacterium GM7ARS4]|nr:DASS family sodium-coupled anion symporter [Alphaproteobacteria bacterium GM7ARS4]